MTRYSYPFEDGNGMILPNLDKGERNLCVGNLWRHRRPCF